LINKGVSVRNPLFFASLAGVFVLLAAVQGCGDSAASKPVPTKEAANSIVDTKMTGKTKAK